MYFILTEQQQPPQHWMQYPLTSRNPYNDDLHLQDQYQVTYSNQTPLRCGKIQFDNLLI